MVPAPFEKGFVGLLALLRGDVLLLHARQVVALLDRTATLVGTDPRTRLGALARILRVSAVVLRLDDRLAVLFLLEGQRLHHGPILLVLLVQTRLELVAEVARGRLLVNREHLLVLRHVLRGRQDQCVRLRLVELASLGRDAESKAVRRWVLGREDAALVLDTTRLDEAARSRNRRILVSLPFALQIALDTETAAVLREESSVGRRKFISFLAHIIPRSRGIVHGSVLDIIIIIGLLDRAEDRVRRVGGGRKPVVMGRGCVGWGSHVVAQVMAHVLVVVHRALFGLVQHHVLLVLMLQRVISRLDGRKVLRRLGRLLLVVLL